MKLTNNVMIGLIIACIVTVIMFPLIGFLAAGGLAAYLIWPQKVKKILGQDDGAPK